jgi:hypothetical protein
MKIELSDAMAVLERTPRALDALLRGLPEPWLRGTEGPETWSPFDVVGHLIHGERTDWIPRLRIILDHGDSRPFEPFDRFAQEEASRGKTLEELLDTFGALRAKNVATLRSLRLSREDMGRRGTHPALGAVTLGQLLATWVAHDMTHLAQVSRVMAKQYADAVGPWSAYLSVLRDRTGG